MSFPELSEAQNRVQKGVARKITKSANESITPVPGVQVTVGNVTSPKSDKNGKFSVNVAQSVDGSYLLSRVRMPEETDYELVLPNISKKLYLSPNDLEIIVISKKEKEEDFKEKYRVLRKKYNDTSKQLIAVREELEDKKLDYDAQSKEYDALIQQLDSVQNLIDQYFNESNREQVTQLLRSIAQEMTLTDYQSLDSLQRKIYDLKCQGDWQTISELILKSMNGNCAAFLKEGKELANAANALARSAQEEFERRCGMVLQQIEAYKMLHKNDSVSYYMDLLIDVNPTNWSYNTWAADFEYIFKGNHKKALELNQKAFEIAETDSLRAINLHNIGKIYNEQGNYNVALDYVQRAMELCISTSGANYFGLIQNYEVLSDIYSNLDMLDKANEMLDKAYNILTQYDDVEEKIRLLSYKGIILYRMGCIKEAFDTTQNALSLVKDNTDESLLKKAKILTNIGVLKTDLGRYKEAYDAFSESLNIQTPILGEVHPNVADNLYHLGELYNTLSQNTRAIEYFQQALNIYREIFGEYSSYVTLVYNNLGNIIAIEDPHAGIEMMLKALDINKKLYGQNHSSVAQVLSNLSTTYIASSEIEKSADALMKSIEIYRRIYGEDISYIITLYNNYALALAKAKEYEKAKEYYIKALEISRTGNDENNTYTSTLLCNIGDFFYSLGQYDESIEYYNKALELREQAFDSDDSVVALSYKKLANIYLKKGDIEQADQNIKKSLSVYKNVLGPNSPTYINYLIDYARFLSKIKNFTQAQEIATSLLNNYMEKLGETHPNTIKSMEILYNIKLDEAKANNNETEFYSSHLPYIYIMEGGEAYNRGLRGKYRMLAIDEWNFTKGESFDYYLQNHSNPCIILFYRDGEITTDSFDGKIGAAAVWAPIDPQEREEILNYYQKWLQDAK